MRKACPAHLVDFLDFRHLFIKFVIRFIYLVWMRLIIHFSILLGLITCIHIVDIHFGCCPNSNSTVCGDCINEVFDVIKIDLALRQAQANITLN